MLSVQTVLLRTVSIFMVVQGMKEVGGQYESTLLEDLQAECTDEGISVKLFFREPFAGVAYSNGHYETPKCRYISHQDEVVKPSGTNFSFLIPINQCGTVYHGGLGTPLKRFRNTRDANNHNENEVYIENTLLVQNDPTIQEAGDLAKTLRCVWQKEIHKPLMATLPFGNVNPKLTPMRSRRPPTGHTEKLKDFSPSSTNYSSRSGYSSGNKVPTTKLRFQMKGQVQSVPAYSRRHHSRSLSVGDDDDNDQTTEFLSASSTHQFNPPEGVLKDQESHEEEEEETISGFSSLPVQDRLISPSANNGSSTRKHGTLLFCTTLTLTIVLMALESCIKLN